MQKILQGRQTLAKWFLTMLKFSDIVKEGEGKLTPSQKKVVDFLLKSPEEAVFLTASSLADRLRTSDTTIVRMAQALGYKGFPGLKSRLRELVQSKITTVDRIGKTIRQIKSIDDVFVNVLQNDVNNLRVTLEDTDMDAFKGAVAGLDRAERVFVIGLRSTHGLASFFTSALRFLKRDVHLLTPGTGEMWEIVKDIGTNDLVAGFSFPRYTKTTVQVVNYAWENGAKILAITDSELSPLAAKAQWTLTVPYEIDSYMESFTAAHSLVNAIVTALAFQRDEETIEALKDMEEEWAERGVYWED